ncbi:hypothetical protein SLS55_005427 [Diplodia seriata]|uniref:Heterokaryon incompatibility domain-containing protein n=1 Tax=Diplodia seriata TaxID=420778 RepID=A0ABR3CGC5_9PEZI
MAPRVEVGGGPRKLDKAFYQYCFHSPCDRCKPEDPLHPSACEFCRHLRLEHLVTCVVPSLEDPSGPRQLVDVDIAFKPYSPGQEDLCDLCCLVTAVSGAYGEHRKFQIQHYAGEEDDGPLSGFSIGGHQGAINIRPFGHDFSSPSGTLTEEVDWDVVRRWTTPPNNKVPDMIPGFKLIDVEQLRIISPKTPCAYATLSYVWGQPQPDEEDQGQKNVDDPFDLSKAILPATIQDAMAVCRNLGYRHLWVDRLCIDQDDNPHKLGQIAAMGTIYASSAITIVAASGDDARSGLAGVSRKRPPDHMTVAWGGVLVLEWTPPVPMLSQTLDRGRWNTRGWTFQEWICASHAVFFTDSGVYGELAADDGIGKKQWAERARGDAPVFDSDESPRDYFEAVEKYTRRALTYPADVLSAFVGVRQWLGPRWGEALHFGLPVEAFDEAVLWRPLRWDGVPRAPAPRETELYTVWPSWAWCSVAGAVTYGHEGWYNKLAGICGSLASWALPSPTGSGGTEELVPVPSMPFMTEMPGLEPCGELDYLSTKVMDWHVRAMSFAWEEGFFPRHYFTREYNDLYAAVSERCSARLKEAAVEELRLRAWESGVRHAKRNGGPAFLEAFSPAHRAKAIESPGRILVLTHRASLDLEYVGILDESRVFLLWSTDGHWLGVIRLAASTADSLFEGKRLSDRLRMDFLALSVTLDLDDVMRTTASRLGIEVQKQPDGTFWPQVGGIQHLHEEIGREHGDGKTEDDFDDRGHVDGSEDFERLWEYHEAEVNFLNGCGIHLSHERCFQYVETPPRINVMLISNEDKDGTVDEKDNTKEKVRVARRLGIGQVYMKRWKDVERKFCSTVLE